MNICPAPQDRAARRAPPAGPSPAPHGDSRTFWLTAGAIAVVLVGFVAWGTINPAEPQAASRAAATPADTRQRELLEANLGQPGDATLGQLYGRINAKHFSGGLPVIPIRWEPRLGEVGELAGRSFRLEGLFGHVGKKTVILLNPTLQADEAALRRALCHEMVHAHLHAAGQSSEQHGPAFQTILRRLSVEGAFEGIVATDEDRSSLRSWLDSESARLDSEEESIFREAAEIERERLELETALSTLTARSSTASPPDARDVAAFNARKERYNGRVGQAQTRAERDRTDRAYFNKEVERYNLMLVYPDGLEEGAVKTKK